jgi:hypothetical protein
MSTPLDPDPVEVTATDIAPAQPATTTTTGETTTTTDGPEETTTGDSTATGSVTTVTVTAPAEPSADTNTDTDAATTTLSILAIPFPTDQNILQSLVGSISAVDHENEETTIVLDCAPTVTSCLESLIPLTITTGPSTFIYTWSWDGPGWGSIPSTATVDSRETIECGIVGTQTLGCLTSHVDSYSGTALPVTTALSVYGTEGFSREAVVITAGVEKLETATSATATSTGDSVDETAGSTPADPEGDSGSGSGSSSKAWIAGPVVGGLVAVALVVGLVFFLRRRRQKRAASATAVAPIAELPEKGVYKGELPAREPAAAELSAVKGQNQIHELA